MHSTTQQRKNLKIKFILEANNSIEQRLLGECPAEPIIFQEETHMCIGCASLLVYVSKHYQVI